MPMQPRPNSETSSSPSIRFFILAKPFAVEVEDARVLQTSNPSCRLPRSAVPHTCGIGSQGDMCIESIACIAEDESGTVSPGNSPGKKATPMASARSTTTVTASARSRQGSTFSSKISAAITTIQVMLITPSEKRAAISAHELTVATVPQTGLLQRRELVEGGERDHAAGHIPAAAVPPEEGEIERADDVEADPGHEPDEHPGEEITGGEQGRQHQ